MESDIVKGNMVPEDMIITPDEPILITGATGFIGVSLVENLLQRGFRRLRCFARPSSEMARLEAIASLHSDRAQVEIFSGNLLRQKDCLEATKGVAVIYHLAAGVAEKSIPDAFMNTVV